MCGGNMLRRLSLPAFWSRPPFTRRPCAIPIFLSRPYGMLTLSRSMTILKTTKTDIFSLTCVRPRRTRRITRSARSTVHFTHSTTCATYFLKRGNRSCLFAVGHGLLEWDSFTSNHTVFVIYRGSKAELKNGRRKGFLLKEQRGP